MVLHLRAQGLGEGDEHPPTLSCGAWSTLTLPLPTDSVFFSVSVRVSVISYFQVTVTVNLNCSNRIVGLRLGPENKLDL